MLFLPLFLQRRVYPAILDFALVGPELHHVLPLRMPKGVRRSLAKGFRILWTAACLAHAIQGIKGRTHSNYGFIEPGKPEHTRILCDNCTLESVLERARRLMTWETQKTWTDLS